EILALILNILLAATEP
ncbi:hypothetical protein, partial [Staphylococcus pseudintermedius]